MKTVSFEIPDEIYQILEKLAEQLGRPIEQVTLEWLAATNPRKRSITAQERAEAWARIRRHAGAGNSGDPNSADNERIDEDLAKEYEDTHDVEE